MPGFWRAVYKTFGYEYNSYNDIPCEKDVKIKQICMRQISLSKVKLKKIEIKQHISVDLAPIKKNEKNEKHDYINVDTPSWFKKSNS